MQVFIVYFSVSGGFWCLWRFPTVSDLRAVKNSESLVENGVSSGSVISYGL